MSAPSKTVILSVALRCVQLGFEGDEIPDEAYGRVTCGEAMLVVHRGPDKCPCCGKPVIRAVLSRKTEIPLEKLFS
jgi:hypothetical protein